MNTWMTWNWCNVYEDILVLSVTAQKGRSRLDEL